MTLVIYKFFFTLGQSYCFHNSATGFIIELCGDLCGKLPQESASFPLALIGFTCQWVDMGSLENHKVPLLNPFKINKLLHNEGIYYFVSLKHYSCFN